MTDQHSMPTSRLFYSKPGCQEPEEHRLCRWDAIPGKTEAESKMRDLGMPKPTLTITDAISLATEAKSEADAEKILRR